MIFVKLRSIFGVFPQIAGSYRGSYFSKVRSSVANFVAKSVCCLHKRLHLLCPLCCLHKWLHLFCRTLLKKDFRTWSLITIVAPSRRQVHCCSKSNYCNYKQHTYLTNNHKDNALSPAGRHLETKKSQMIQPYSVLCRLVNVMICYDE